MDLFHSVYRANFSNFLANFPVLMGCRDPRSIIFSVSVCYQVLILPLFFSLFPICRVLPSYHILTDLLGLELCSLMTFSPKNDLIIFPWGSLLRVGALITTKNDRASRSLSFITHLNV